MHDHLSVLCWEDVVNLTTESVCAHIGVCARVCVFCISGLSYKTGVISVDVFARMFRDPIFSSYIIPVVRLPGKKKKAACYAHLSVFLF